jgi:3-(3-hydroxy-phenyl)propionate hydroxylase
MSSSEGHVYDVIVVGAGPAGLTTANLLGADGLNVLVLEAGEDILDYPRAVGIDDESLRTFQTVGLVDALLPHTDPDTHSILFDANRRMLASFGPKGRPYGWSRGSAFIQPLADRVLLEGLSRYPNVTLRFGSSFVSATEYGDQVRVKVRDGELSSSLFRTRYLVGADGGSSAVRKDSAITFDGKTTAAHWLVADLADDPLGTPHATAICDPRRTIVSIKLPHGVRRLEFKLHEHESDEEMSQGPGLQQLLGLIVPKPSEVSVIRARVYRHHSRLAAAFRKGRVLLVGDAAHVMPVWQGQGYNNGIRDAVNLAWKLSAVTRGIAADALLDTYETERRPHAAEMVKVSTYLGHLITTDNRWLAKVRDTVMRGIRRIPPLNDYVAGAEFKPMPSYGQGVVVMPAEGPAVKAVGHLMPQPWVLTPAGKTRLDDVLGTGFALLSWGMDPLKYADESTRQFWHRIGAKVVVAVPSQQLDYCSGVAPEQLFIGDDGVLRDWFSQLNTSVVAIRPDRIVALATGPQELPTATTRMRAAVHYRCDDVTEVPPHASRPSRVV